MKEKWNLVGYDTFSEETYPLGGNYPSEQKAQEAAHKRLVALEISQPSEDSGGQGILGIQDRVFIQRPDKTIYRALPVSRENTK